MKHLVLASIFCLTLSAQAPQLIQPSPNIGVWSVVQGIQNSHQQHELLVPRELKIAKGINLMKDPNEFQSVCSVPLLEAHVDASDPGIATTPRDNSVPIRQAHVPAPPCKKQ
jgi:hypothetical protein